PVARSSGEEYSGPAGLDEDPTPERAVPIEHATRREVLSGRQGDWEWCSARGLPPVDLLDLTDAGRPEQPAIAERCHDRWLKAPVESLRGAQIAVIVVVMTQEHERDGGQIVEAHALGPNPTGSRERYRARPLGVHRIDQDAGGSHLKEKGGVTDERDDHLARSGVGRPPRLDRTLRRPPGPWREQDARQHPERLTIRAGRLEKSAAIVVIGAA